MAFHYSGVGPPSYGRLAELLPVVTKNLKDSHVKPGDKVVIYTDTKKNRDIVDAFFTACAAVGTRVSVVITTPRDDPDREPLELPLEMMKKADVLIDLASVGWLYTKAFSEVLDQGVRILSSMSDIDTIIKMAPRDEYRRRARNGGRFLNHGKIIRVTSSAGTDLTVSIEGRRGNFRDGVLSDVGEQWDNFPACHCAAAPVETLANGTMRINSGDILLTLKRIVTEPITLTLKDGRITDVQGGGDALLLAGWLRKWNDPNSYVISHIGFGCDPRADVAAMQLMEWEALAGGVMIAFGANHSRFLGGKNVARSHIDIVLRNANFAVDGVTLLEAGEFVHPDLIVDGE